MAGLSDRCNTGLVLPAFSTPSKEAEVYFGVFVPDTSEVNDEDFEKVHTDKATCLTVMKKCRGARFKSFSTYEDALHFAENGPAINMSHSICSGEDSKCSNLNVEKPSPFRGPKSQDLVKFRKAIEKNDMTYFDQCLEENPRYLVSSGDTPAILQEGSRYNALHVACRTDKPQFVSKVLITVADAQFFQKLYPDDTLESSERRSSYLLDAYLNTPDKGLNETPLHFASKHGSMECVRILTSYADCCKTRKNKFSQAPLDVVGTRAKNISKREINDICNLLGSHYYVPLLRDDDLCMMPQVGEPWSPKQDSPGITEEQQLLSCLSPVRSDSPLSPVTPTLKVRGYAGPMSPSQADSFYRRWRETGVLSPTRNTRGRSPSLRMTDQEKGLERLGRDLALTSGHTWNEYWNFLGAFTNLASDDGLSKLERHLKQKFKELSLEKGELDTSDLNERLGNLTDAESNDTISSLQENEDKKNSINLEDSDVSRTSQSTMGELCQELEALRLNASLSPQLDSSGQPIISASSKFLQLWKEREKLKSPVEDVVDNSAHQDSDIGHLSYIVKSIHVSAFRLSEVLGDLAKELQSSRITNLSVGTAVRTKLKPEILCLRNVVGNSFTNNLEAEIDCGFVHILLAFKATELIQENQMPSDICVLAETLRVVVSNLNFMEGNSSDEEDDDSVPESNRERQENARHVSCVLRALEKALTIAYNNCSSDISSEDTGINMRMHLLQLGECTCCWDSEGHEIIGRKLNNKTPAATQKYNKAFNFLHQTLFSDNKKVEINRNEISYRESNTVVKQLTFEEGDKEKGNMATLTVGNGKSGDLNVPVNEEDGDNDDNDSFATAPSSVEDNMLTPEEGLKVFINGSEASKLDADVLAAIEATEIEERRYPHVAQWLHLINTHSEAQRSSWTTPYQGQNRPMSLPRRLPGSHTGTPPRHHRPWVPSSAPRILFGKQHDKYPSSPS